jgi:hypothetical protein
MKIRSVGAELFLADRRTDELTDRSDKANSRFSKFCERAYTLLLIISLITYVWLSLCHSLCCWVEGRNDAYCDGKSDDSDNSNKKTVTNEICFL